MTRSEVSSFNEKLIGERIQLKSFSFSYHKNYFSFLKLLIIRFHSAQSLSFLIIFL